MKNSSYSLHFAFERMLSGGAGWADAHNGFCLKINAKRQYQSNDQKYLVSRRWLVNEPNPIGKPV